MNTACLGQKVLHFDQTSALIDTLQVIELFTEYQPHLQGSI